LDLVFVAVFGWGVIGVAVATVLSQFVSAFLCLWRLMRMRDVFDVGKKYLLPTKQYVGQVLKLGLPTGVSHAVFSIAMVVVQSLINSFGPTFIACNVIVMKVDGFVMMPNFTFSNAIMVFAGQNMGAGKIDRVKKGATQCMYMAVGTAIVIVGAMLIFCRPLIGLFTTTPALIDMSVRMLQILAIGYVAFAASQVPMGVIRGAGDTMTPMWLSFLTTIVMRIPLAYLLAYLLNSPDSIFISMLIVWLLNAVFSFIAYRIGKWRSKAIVTAQ
jgi:putative MATE family efflux protein